MSTTTTTANAVIAQSGGPTSVINQSLAGCVQALRGGGRVGRIFGARHGVKGMVRDDFIDLTDIDHAALERVARTPSAALGSTRDKPDDAYCAKIFESLARRDIRWFFYIGGNDSSDTCRIVRDKAKQAGYPLRAYHIPKTIDNDLMCNDHTPGFGSAARWVATAFMSDNLDNRALPGIKINVVMGRNAGFLTAASALGRRHDDDGPHLVYVPERVFDPEDFVADVDRVHARLGRCVVAVSEGVKDRAGNAVTAMMADRRETDAHGNIQLSGTGVLGDFLAERLRQDLGKSHAKLRVRADTFGYIQRSAFDVSEVDAREARDVGEQAALAAIRDRHFDGGASVIIERESTDPYYIRYGLVPLEHVAAKTRTLPEEFLAPKSPDVSEAFIRYARPLVGPLPEPGMLTGP